MYLVELQPGTEVLYHTVAELTAAIRSGDVGSQSWIYHRASATWVPITVHPEYKRVTGQHPIMTVELPPLTRKRWTFFNAEGVDAPVVAPRVAQSAPVRPKPTAGTVVGAEPAGPRFRQLFRGAVRWLRRPKVA
jgi:hypothetical protein